MRKKILQKAIAAGMTALLAVLLPTEQTLAATMGNIIRSAPSGEGAESDLGSGAGNGGSGGVSDSGSGSSSSGGSAGSGSGNSSSGGSSNSGSGDSGGGGAGSGSGNSSSGGSSNSGSGNSEGSAGSGSGNSGSGGSSNSGSGNSEGNAGSGSENSSPGGSSNSGSGNSGGEGAGSGSESSGSGGSSDSGSGNSGGEDTGSENGNSGSGGSSDTGSGSGGSSEGSIGSESGNSGSGGSSNSGSGSGNSGGGGTGSGSGNSGSGGGSDIGGGTTIPEEGTDPSDSMETSEAEHNPDTGAGPGAEDESSGIAGGGFGSGLPGPGGTGNEKKDREQIVNAPFPGEGTEESPYLISTAKDLEKLAEVMVGDYEAYGSSCYRLANNIRMKKGRNNHTPIGSVEQPFNGEFDGDGYIIEGLSIYKPKKEAQGLFAVIGEAGTVRSTGLKDNRICGQSDVGAVAGINFGVIEACFQTGEVYGLKNNTGTIAGRNSGTVTNCYSTGLAAGGYRTGDYIPEVGEDEGGRSAGRGGFRDFIQTVAETIAETVAYVIEETKAGLETLYELVTTAFSSESTQTQMEAGSETDTEGQTESMSPEDSIADVETLSEEPGTELEEESEKRAVGGLVGRNTGGVVENCYQAGRLSARNDSWSAGGICGVSNDGILDNLFYIQRAPKSDEEPLEENGISAVSSEFMTGEDSVERLGLEAEFWVGKAADENREESQSEGPGAIKDAVTGPGMTTAGDQEIMPGTTEPGNSDIESMDSEITPKGSETHPKTSETAQTNAAEESDQPIRYRHYYPQLTVFAEKGQAHPYTLGVLEVDGLRIDSLSERAYVSSEEGWNWLFASEEYINYTVILETDLDLSGFRKSIGTWEKPFTGILDGDGHVISGLRQPLFGIMGEGSAVYYLLLDQSEVTGTIVRGSHDASAEAETAGMLAAYTEGTVIDSCGAVGTVTLRRHMSGGRPVYAGGLIGEAGAGTSIYESYAFVNILETLDGNSWVTVGGFAGMIGTDAGADNCYATGRLDCSGVTGGFAGENRGEIRDSFVTTIIGSTARQAGAFVGKMDGAAENQIADNLKTSKQTAFSQAVASRVPVARVLLKSSAPADLLSLNTEQMSEKSTSLAGKSTQKSETETFRTEEKSAMETSKGYEDKASTKEAPTEKTPTTDLRETEITKEPQETKSEALETPGTSKPAGTSSSEETSSPAGTSSPEETSSPTGSSSPEETPTPPKDAHEETTSGPSDPAFPSTELDTDMKPEEKGPGIPSTSSEAEKQTTEPETIPEPQTGHEQSAAKEEWVKQNKTITGCAYDSQMSGCTDRYTEPLQTVDMTGADAVLPGGDWYMTEGAYPQLKCMALHTDETYILRSKASAIPLILPSGINLSDMPEEKEAQETDEDIKISGSVEVRIPMQIDGDPIQWTDPERMTVQEDGRAIVELD